ncbi:acyltransferase [Gloeobacter kilaueensis]|uniref:Acyl transferase n=1 Tax=Gloeobacter kilaueensis (strain ATCC BAA-2537 / CCAP 1431/1 / ULC 316 / JS1) TaxID=1183438 RepID=U5QL62_GLOK1|nr:acyltransferase [Gloeobacter kilaueensis]AGY58400.1 acyl transferase [Gloeobacter kilaueensis JS1]
MKTLLAALTLLLPWPVRRWVLVRFWGYRIDPTSRIGLAWIFPRRLVLAAHSQIGHLNVCRGLDELRLEEHARIGRLNWISGFPARPDRHFAHQPERSPRLVLGRHAAITHRHLIDCTDTVRLGNHAILGGYRSQVLTHAIDLERGRQHAAPVQIGNYCFVGTSCVLLGGSRLPDHSVLGAMSLLKDAFSEEYTLYAGVPATARKNLGTDWKYFSRPEGYVW